jgi:hypothetical protein
LGTPPTALVLIKAPLILLRIVNCSDLELVLLGSEVAACSYILGISSGRLRIVSVVAAMMYQVRGGKSGCSRIEFNRSGVRTGGGATGGIFER